MPTIIDSLLVTLGLDDSNFTQGQKKASADLKRTKEDANSAAKQISASGKQAAEFFTKLRNEAIGLFSVFMGARGVKDFVQSITQGDAAVGRLAHNLDISTETLSAWEGAAERVGGSASGMDSSMQSLTSEIQNFALTGQSSVIPYFRALGVAVTDHNGKMRQVGDIYLDLADKFSHMDPARASAFGRHLGMDQGTINLLEQGRAGVAKLLEEQRKLGVVSEKDAENAQRLQKNFADLRQAFTSIGRTIVNELTPGIIELLKGWGQWLQANREWITINVAKWVRDAATEVKDFVVEVDAIVKSMGGWKTVSEEIFAVWATAKVVGLVANIGKVAAALALLRGGGAAGAAGGAGGLLGGAGIMGLIGRLGVWGAALAAAYATWKGIQMEIKTPGGTSATPETNRRMDQLRRERSADPMSEPHDGYNADGTPKGSTPYSGPTESLSHRVLRYFGFGDHSQPRGIRNNNPLNLEAVPGQQGLKGSDGRFGVYGSMEEGVASNLNQLLLYQDRDHLNTIQGIVGKWAPAGENDPNSYAAFVAQKMGLGVNDKIDLHDPKIAQAVIAAMAQKENGKRISEASIAQGVSMRLGTPAPAVQMADKPPSAPPAQQDSPALAAIRAGIKLAQAKPAPSTGETASADPQQDNSNLQVTLASLRAGAAEAQRISRGMADMHSKVGVMARLRQGAVREAGATHNSAETNIGNVTIHTKATDAKGIARSLADHLREATIVPQSSYGLA
jgi:hypothetical protein